MSLLNHKNANRQPISLMHQYDFNQIQAHFYIQNVESFLPLKLNSYWNVYYKLYLLPQFSFQIDTIRHLFTTQKGIRSWIFLKFRNGFRGKIVQNVGFLQISDQWKLVSISIGSRFIFSFAERTIYCCPKWWTSASHPTHCLDWPWHMKTMSFPDLTLSELRGQS